MSENIILIGFMGTGKDLVGKELSKLTGKVLFSTDEFITNAMNMPINGIFDRYGEKYFRKMERKVIVRIRDLKDLIVATGGGIVIDQHNRRILKKMGRVVHLETGIGEIKKRLKDDATRPLIRDARAIKRLFEERKRMYDFADLRVFTAGKRPKEIAADIVNALRIVPKRNAVPASRIWLNTPSKRYPVYVCAIQNDLGKLLKNTGLPGGDGPARAVVISNPLVFTLYGQRIVTSLRNCGIRAEYHIIPDGERFKDLKTAGSLYDRLLKDNFDRGDMLISLGGGVICDIAGFVASTYKRGMHLVHVPTTLLAQADAAIGGKTGVDHPLGKNMIGTFYQPDMVLCDVAMLSTLSESEFRNGIAEVIKHGAIGNRGLFEFLKMKKDLIRKRDISSLKKIVAGSIAVKRSIIEKDEREEREIREVLNFGHTIGHAIETLMDYKRFSHGEAVAMGMVEETSRWGIMRNPGVKELTGLMSTYGLPVSMPAEIKTSRINRIILQDKKRRGNMIRIPVLAGIGKAVLKNFNNGSDLWK